MIVIAGNPFDITDLLSEYSSRSVEYEVLKKLADSSAEYRYDNIEQLKFELALRKETVEAAIKLAGSGFRFAVFHDSEGNEDFWDRTENGGFKVKDGISPFDAIDDIYQHGRKYATECATAMMIVYYRALSQVLGKDLFDKMFPGIYLMDWYIRHTVLDSIGTPIKVDDKLIGDRGYFNNPDVDPEHPEWQGENVIILPNDKFYGHGVGVTTAERIIDSLNHSRKKDPTEVAYFMDEVSRPDFKLIYNKSEKVKNDMTSQS